MRNETQIREEIEGLRSLTTAQLKEKYHEVFGERSRSNHKQFLFRRIAWRIQANAWGGLSERARRRALEIADDADLRIRAPKNFLREPIDDGRTIEARLKPSLDPRLPLPGTPLIRRFQGKDRHPTGPSLPRQGHRGHRPAGWLRVRRATLRVAERCRARGDGHSVERVHLLPVRRARREQAWRPQVRC